jgi:hypothetical protein
MGKKPFSANQVSCPHAGINGVYTILQLTGCFKITFGSRVILIGNIKIFRTGHYTEENQHNRDD